jgi:hypothetical protein
MRLVNSVSPQIELRSAVGREREILTLLRSSAFRRYRKLTGQIRPDTILRIFNDSRKFPETFNVTLARYNLLRDSRDWLRAIAKRFRDPSAKRAKLFSLPPVQRLRVTARTDERAILHFAPHPLLKALEGTDATRIRRCPICGKIYWAERIDSGACKKTCKGTRRTRKWRIRYQERYKPRRIAKKEQTESEHSSKHRAPRKATPEKRTAVPKSASKGRKA